MLEEFQLFSLEFCIVLLTEFNKLANNAIEPSCTDAHIFNEIMMSPVDASSQETLKKGYRQKN